MGMWMRTLGGERDLLEGLGEIAADVRQESAAGDLGLALRLADGVGLADAAEVVGEAALDGVAQSERAGEGGGGRIGRGTRVRARDMTVGLMVLMLSVVPAMGASTAVTEPLCGLRPELASGAGDGVRAAGGRWALAIARNVCATTEAQSRSTARILAEERFS